jgi:TonB family protein
MTTPRSWPAAVACALFLAAGVPVGTQPAADGLADARARYHDADYAAALALLDAAAQQPAPAAEVALYRGLCLLALGRAAEADEAFHAYVARDPAAAPADDVPPRVRERLTRARREVLPAAARARYAAGKVLYGGQQFADAEREFAAVQALLAPPVLEPLGFAGDEALRDLRLLADEYAELSRVRAGAVDTASAGPRAAARPDGAAPGPARDAEPAATGTAGRHPEAPVPTATVPPAAGNVPASRPAAGVAPPVVVPPVTLDQRIPAWPGPRALVPITGRLEILIDTRGRVAAATVVTSMGPEYDARLLQAARLWRYRPALRDGSPTTFLKTIEVVVDGR